MNTKIMWVIIVLLVIIGGAYYYKVGPRSEAVSQTGPATTGKIVPRWSFADAGTSKSTGAQSTKVVLSLGDTMYDAGTYDGSCAEISSEGGVDGTGLLEGEVSGVQCWFAGGGDEVGLFQENGALSLKHGELGEPQGDSEGGDAGAFRGNFSTLLTI